MSHHATCHTQPPMYNNLKYLKNSNTVYIFQCDSPLCVFISICSYYEKNINNVNLLRTKHVTFFHPQICSSLSQLHSSYYRKTCPLQLLIFMMAYDDNDTTLRLYAA